MVSILLVQSSAVTQAYTADKYCRKATISMGSAVLILGGALCAGRCTWPCFLLAGASLVSGRGLSRVLCQSTRLRFRLLRRGGPWFVSRGSCMLSGIVSPGGLGTVATLWMRATRRRCSPGGFRWRSRSFSRFVCWWGYHSSRSHLDGSSRGVIARTHSVSIARLHANSSSAASTEFKQMESQLHHAPPHPSNLSAPASPSSAPHPTASAP
jgi:hypothetical protein